ncbi:MAG: hypothetical protein IPJ00_09085 [Saprospirales bacterium]|nr:hypothetical protein [Saprospirales bacterium]
MAKFRTQHSRQGRSPAGIFLIFGGALALLLLLVFGKSLFYDSLFLGKQWSPASPENRFFLPGADPRHQVIHYPYYSVGMDSPGRTTVWAAWELDALADTDYQKTFFDSLTFSLAPQAWKALGKSGQDLVGRLGHVYFTAGPAASGQIFCALLDNGQKIEAAGILLGDSLQSPIVLSIDSIETLTGLDLFAELWVDSLEAEVEKAVHIAHWEPEIRFNPYFVPENK